MSSILYVKHRLIGTPLDRPLNRLRWMSAWRQRRRHPELHGMFHESDQMDAAVRRLVTPTMNCIDGGCHIGAMLSLFTTIAPEGHHIAFEPVEAKARWLRKRWPKADVHQAAIGDVAGQATFTENRSRPGMSSLHNDHLDDDLVTTTTVAVVTIDDTVDDRPIGFLKLDVEGNELPALRGARKTIDRCKPAILFEAGPPWTLTTFGYTRGEMFDFIHDELGYSLWLVSDYLFSRPPMGHDEFERCGTYPFPGFNYIALPIGTELTPLEQLDRDAR